MDECGLDLGCNISNFVQGEAGKLAKQLYDGQNEMFNTFFTSWITDPAKPVIGGTSAEWFAFVVGPLQWILLVCGLMVSGIVTMFNARGDAAKAGMVRFGRAIGVQAIGTVTISILSIGSLELARWILITAKQTAPPGGLMGDFAMWSGNVAMALIFGALGALMVGIQWVIMLFRAIALTVITPFWPVSAAAAMFDKHQGAFEKITTWIIAFLLYSPIAALLYGYAIVLRLGYNGIEAAMYGTVIFTLAIAVLPALMKLVAPIASAVGNASSGGMLVGGVRTTVLAAAAAGAVVATGGAAAAGVGAGAAGAGAGATAGGAATATGGGSAAAAQASSGSAGAAGSAGSAGPSGAAEVGASGGSGAAGAQGASGAHGAGGSSGEGTQGAQGSSGADGARGGGGDGLRDLAYLLPQGSGQNSLTDTFDGE